MYTAFTPAEIFKKWRKSRGGGRFETRSGPFDAGPRPSRRTDHHATKGRSMGFREVISEFRE